MKAKLVMEVDDRGGVHVSSKRVSMETFVVLSGALQQFVGMEALRRGADMEEIRDHLLDVHLAAMEEVAQKAIRQKGSAGQGAV